VEPEDTNDIVRGIEEALVRKSELNILGNNGYEYAKLHFDRTLLAKQYLENVERLLN